MSGRNWIQRRINVEAIRNDPLEAQFLRHPPLLDLQPLPMLPLSPDSPANDGAAPRFARPPSSWALRMKEASRESSR